MKNYKKFATRWKKELCSHHNIKLRYRWVKTADCGKTIQIEQYRSRYLANSNSNQIAMKTIWKFIKFATGYQKTVSLYLFSRKITSFKFAQKVQKILVPSVTTLLPVSINFNFHALNCITKLKSVSFQQKKLHVNIFFHCCTIINQKTLLVWTSYDFCAISSPRPIRIVLVKMTS